MEGNYKLQMPSAVLLSLLLVAPVTAQTARSNQPTALLEFVLTSCLGSRCDSYTSRIYADGKVIGEAETKNRVKSGRFRKVLTRVETQLEAEELAEAVSLAEQPDFFNALPVYTVKVVQDDPSWISIAYLKEAKDKRVKVYNYIPDKDAGTAKLPPSLVKIIDFFHRLY